MMDWQDIERSLLEALHAAFPRSWEPWMQVITSLGSLEILGSLVIVAVLVLSWRRHWQNARLVMFSGLLALALREILKALFHRARPELWATPPEASFSFPSGHALSSVVIYGVLVYLVGQSRPSWRPILWGIYGILIATIGFSRLYLGLHWPSDVLGGWAIGALVLFGLIRWHERGQKLYDSKGTATLK